MTQSSTERRPARPRAVLTVQSQQWISPSMVRIQAGGPGFAQFRTNDFTDKYVKLHFVDPADQQPVTRTYTVRSVDADRQSLAIDFLVHGDAGIAGPWAAGARTGDTLTLSGAGGAYAPDPADDWHLFLGDEAALPAISAALDALPADARGLAYLETSDPDPTVPARVPAKVEVTWLRRDHPGAAPALLADALRAGPWWPGRVGVFAHGERESMKAIRAALKERDLGGGSLSISGYWAHGRTEDRFQAEKREPVGQIGG